jgi:hypothetical protein
MIALIMEAVRTSETSVSYNETALRNIPEGSHLHARRREKLRSNIVLLAAVNVLQVVYYCCYYFYH